MVGQRELEYVKRHNFRGQMGLKILFLPSWYPSDLNRLNGPFTREHAIAASLFDEVIVLYPYETPFLLKRFYRYYEFFDSGIPTAHAEFNVFFPGMFYRLYIRAALRGFDELRRFFVPDIVHGHVSYPGGVAASVLAEKIDVPLVITEHASAFPQLFGSRRAIGRGLSALKQADLILPISNYLRHRIEGEGIDGPFEVVPNIADTKLFYLNQNDVALRQSIGDLFKIVAVAILVPRKGIDVLLKAVAALTFRDKLRLDIIGDGPELGQLVQLARELGIDRIVRFHGAKSKAEVAEIMRESHLLVHSSLLETFGCVIAEAMACGKPVVVTKCGGPEEFVTEECGVLVPVKDTEALAQGIEFVYENYAGYDQRAIASYARERFSHEAVGKQLHQAYDRLMCL